MQPPTGLQQLDLVIWRSPVHWLLHLLPGMIDSTCRGPCAAILQKTRNHIHFKAKMIFRRAASCNVNSLTIFFNSLPQLFLYKTSVTSVNFHSLKYIIWHILTHREKNLPHYLICISWTNFQIIFHHYSSSLICIWMITKEYQEMCFCLV